MRYIPKLAAQIHALQANDYSELGEMKSQWKKLWNDAETVFAYRSDLSEGPSKSYRDSALCKCMGQLLFESAEKCDCCSDSVQSLELWMIERIGLLFVAHFCLEDCNRECVTEFRILPAYGFESMEEVPNMDMLISDLAESCTERFRLPDFLKCR